MNLKIFSSLLILATVIELSSSSTCETRRNNCDYEVTCVEIVQLDFDARCHGEPNITLTITNSSETHLSDFFFWRTSELYFNDYVKKIKAVNNHWPHIRRSAFSIFHNCVHLDLSNNSIITMQLGFNTLPNVQFLNLSSNNIHSLGWMTSYKTNSLSELDLSNNKLLYLRHELNLWGELKKLYLQNNHLEAIDEERFADATELTHLYLQNNRLMTISNSLQFLKNLRILDISNNYLRQLLASQVNKWVSIVSLNVSHNELTIVEPYCFNRSLDLKELDFSFNRINMTIDTNMFIKNHKLNYLNFENNKIGKLQDNAFQHCNLSYLNLKHNNIVGSISNKTYANLTNITRLDLSQQRIARIENNTFFGMNRLLLLNLSDNSIYRIENSSFVNTSISVLDLSYNKISNVYFLKKCLANLTELYLNNNNIIEIPKRIFDYHTQLKRLDLSSNQIVRIEENALLLNIPYYNIVGNILSDIVITNHTFLTNRTFKHLVTDAWNYSTTPGYLKLWRSNTTRYLNVSLSVDLSGTNLGSINKTFLVKYKHSLALNVSKNQIAEIPPGTFELMKTLKLLNLSSNHITLLQYGSLEGLYELEVLDLSRNNIRNLDVEVFYVCGELKSLIIDYNRIKTFDVNRIYRIGLNKLRNLSLGGNLISCKEIVYSMNPRNSTYIHVKINSIDKIYNEENVHGIKCGDAKSPSLMESVLSLNNGFLNKGPTSTVKGLLNHNKMSTQSLNEDYYAQVNF